MLGLKARRGIRGEFKWRYFAPGNAEPRNPMRHLLQADRDSIRSEIYRIICADGETRTMAAICSAPAAFAMASVADQNDIYQFTYKTISERFQYYLQDKSAPGRKEYGIVVCDHRGAQDDKRLRAHHQKLLHSSAEFTSRYKNLIEGLFLEPSNLSVGIQLADMVAGAVWRSFQKQDHRWFEQLLPSFRRSADGNISGYGLIKVPKSSWR